MALPKRVLIVSNNESFFPSVGEEWQASGCVFDRVCDSKELTAALEAKSCDLVVVDLKASENQSYDFLRILYHGAYDVPVLAVTGKPPRL